MVMHGVRISTSTSSHVSGGVVASRAGSFLSQPHSPKPSSGHQATRDLVREEHRGFHKHPIWDTCSGSTEAKEKNRMSFGANTWAGARPDLVWQGRGAARHGI